MDFVGGGRGEWFGFLLLLVNTVYMGVDALKTYYSEVFGTVQDECLGSGFHGHCEMYRILKKSDYRVGKTMYKYLMVIIR